MNRRNFLKGFLLTAAVVALAPNTLVEIPVTEATKFVSFEEIAQITLNRYRRVIADSVVSKGHAVFYRWQPVVGGIDLVEPLIYE